MSSIELSKEKRACLIPIEPIDKPATNYCRPLVSFDSGSPYPCEAIFGGVTIPSSFKIPQVPKSGCLNQRQEGRCPRGFDLTKEV